MGIVCDRRLLAMCHHISESGVFQSNIQLQIHIRRACSNNQEEDSKMAHELD